MRCETRPDRSSADAGTVCRPNTRGVRGEKKGMNKDESGATMFARPIYIYIYTHTHKWSLFFSLRPSLLSLSHYARGFELLRHFSILPRCVRPSVGKWNALEQFMDLLRACRALDDGLEQCRQSRWWIPPGRRDDFADSVPACLEFNAGDVRARVLKFFQGRAKNGGFGQRFRCHH